MNVYRVIRYLLSVYITGILFFTAARCILLLTNLHKLQGVPHLWRIIPVTMLMGLRFDTAVSGYILLVPAIILLIASIAGIWGRRILLAVQIYSCIIYALCLFLCAADIPFFANYNDRINISLLNWTDYPAFMANMVWQDNTFLLYFMLFLAMAAAFIIVTARIYKHYKNVIISSPADKPPINRLYSSFAAILFIACVLLAIRGRIDEKSPIVPGTAYFCNYSLPNQAGLNPVFTFIWSWTDISKDENKPLKLIDDNTAINIARQYLHLQPGSGSIARYITAHSPAHNYNVVVVLMESMSANYMTEYGNKLTLTPNLDSLAENGYCFDNFYSAGIHTFNGIFSTLYGYPALLASHTMEGTIIPSYTGMPYFFNRRGYDNIYFTTHDDQFDNVGGFLNTNYMHTIISSKDYHDIKKQSTLGIADHDMFNVVVSMLSSDYDKHTPFFATCMTASNHNPFVIPDDIPFSPKHTDIRGGCVEYADWAIGHFMKEAAQTKWFDSTVFVFLGDHGTSDYMPYGDMQMSYSHIPCIIYSPIFRAQHKHIRTPAGQIDVMPTVAGLLGGDYINTTMGIDALHDSRTWMLFSQDDKIGVADTSELYIWEKNGMEYLFLMGGDTNLLSGKKAKADSMRIYAFSMIQYAQWLRNNKKTGLSAVK